MTQPGITPSLLGSGQLPAARGASVGQVIAGKYRIERVLGQGGMGVVVAARQLQLERTVAIKLIRPDWSHDASAIERLLREAKALASLNSEHVARVLDVGTSEDGLPFIVMEYLEGSDLETLLTREGPLPLVEAIDYLLQACEAVAEAHRNHIVHRDLKPANLFVAKQPGGVASIKVVDFGISKLINSRAVDTLTRPSGIVGSLYHMAPEQMRSEPVDARTDVWALGAVLFEMLTGLKPFSEAAWPALCSDQLPEPQPALDVLDACAPADVVEAVRKCLHRSPDDRYANVAELAVVLSPFGTRNARLSLEHIVRLATSTGSLSARDFSEAALAVRPPSAPPAAAAAAASAEPAAASAGQDSVAPVSDPSAERPTRSARSLFGATPAERRRRRREVLMAAAAGFLTLVVLPVVCVSQTYHAKEPIRREPELVPAAAATSTAPATQLPASPIAQADAPRGDALPPPAAPSQATAALQPAAPVPAAPVAAAPAPALPAPAARSAPNAPAAAPQPLIALPVSASAAAHPAHPSSAAPVASAALSAPKSSAAHGAFDIIRTPPDVLDPTKPAAPAGAGAAPPNKPPAAPSAAPAAPAAPAPAPGRAPSGTPSTPKAQSPGAAAPADATKPGVPAQRVVDPWNLKDLPFE